ncbi:hypothetical protein [Streptomyces sp. NPDC016675]|jgi:hypothetical protein|uniref:hypothetical protein n=1 Tax=Streptomyces sp. NPDC016675 TaxID=3364970 RepID=UPI0036F820A5
MLQTSRVIVLQPVLEVYASDDFTLWPVAKSAPYGFLLLSGALDPAEVGTAVMRIADCNNIDPEDDGRPPRPRPTRQLPAWTVHHGRRDATGLRS